MRTEKDFLGEKEIPEEALYGIHTVRALENFPAPGSFHQEWFRAIGLTKLACYETYKQFKKSALAKHSAAHSSLKFIEDIVLEALISSARELSEGTYFEQFRVPAVQGGAGTSINMNVNEIIANASLLKTGCKPGQYDKIDPIEEANVFQSTNDVIPTSLKLAAMKLLMELEEEINRMRFLLEELEKKHRHDLRVAYTQMQEAVPSSWAGLFSGYNEAFSRDWWRVSKCLERIKVVNLGGGATGTGLSLPRFFIMEVVANLQKLTGLPVTRSENLQDATSNLDALVEVHATMKSHAVNLEKTVSDLRLLSSDLAAKPELSIPARQTGSSIMPGKVNPVIPEYVISIAHKVYSNDQLISSLSGQGCLDLNAYLPVIGHALLESITLLTAANQSLRKNLISGIQVNTVHSLDKLYRSPSITTALTPWLGYHKAAELAREMKENKLTIFEANKILNLMAEDKLKNLLEPGNLLKLGFSLNDLGLAT
jgi:aspartate ammonia-lyase